MLCMPAARPVVLNWATEVEEPVVANVAEPSVACWPLKVSTNVTVPVAALELDEVTVAVRM